MWTVLLAVVLTFFGTLVGFRYTDRQSRLINKIAEVKSEIDSIANRGYEYWILPPGSEISNLSVLPIENSLKQLGASIQWFDQQPWITTADASRHLTAFRQAITGGNFATVGHSPDHQRAEDVKSASHSLKLALDGASVDLRATLLLR